MCAAKQCPVRLECTALIELTFEIDWRDVGSIDTMIANGMLPCLLNVKIGYRYQRIGNIVIIPLKNKQHALKHGVPVSFDGSPDHLGVWRHVNRRLRSVGLYV